MEVTCPGCGSNASQILEGTDGCQYAKCLDCGEIQLLEMQASPPLPADTEAVR